MTFSAVILAGGSSLRMGCDKAWLNVDGEPLLARQIKLVRKLKPAEILISGRTVADYSAFGLPVVHDRLPDRGPLGGIAAGLEASSSPNVLILAVDMPGMLPHVLQRLLDHCSAERGVVPRTVGGIEPLVAVYPRTTLPLALHLLSTERRSVRHFAEKAGDCGLISFVNLTSEDSAVFFNWNFPGQTQRD